MLVCPNRAVGALVVVVAVQVSVEGLYLPPVLKNALPAAFSPPQTIISVPVQTPGLVSRAVGALVVLMAVHVSVLGL